MRISDWSSDVCSSDLQAFDDDIARRQPIKLRRDSQFEALILLQNLGRRRRLQRDTAPALPQPGLPRRVVMRQRVVVGTKACALSRSGTIELADVIHHHALGVETRDQRLHRVLADAYPFWRIAGVIKAVI